MNILVINGDCVQTNTSANLCHLAYIKGLVDLGHDVTLLSADGKDYDLDSSMVIPEEVKHVTYYGVTLYEKLSLRKKKSSQAAHSVTNGREEDGDNRSKIVSVLAAINQKVKRTWLSFYGVHGIYAKFVRKAQAFRSEEIYDYIISISTPVTSHLLAHNLIKAKHISGKHWIQIWEDPWYSDAYGFNHKKKIYKEERRLISFAESVCYVSPLTLRNQQKLFPKDAHKMYWQPLPYYYKEKEKNTVQLKNNVYGYFGDYAPVARNLQPFYEAADKESIEVNICGNPYELFRPTEKIHIYPRLPLEKLEPIENSTNVLVFLCNRRGGQIPGKIYQYSATGKTILFILDGTREEQKVLEDYFKPFNRYVFCKNTEEDIRRAINDIENGNYQDVRNEPIEDFNPKVIIQKILKR